jgi:hypothetical protein
MLRFLKKFKFLKHKKGETKKGKRRKKKSGKLAGPSTTPGCATPGRGDEAGVQDLPLRVTTIISVYIGTST